MCLGDGWLNIIQLYIYNAFITPTAHLKGMKTLREFLTIVCGSRLQFGAIRSKVRLTFWVLKIEAQRGSGRGNQGCNGHGMVRWLVHSVGPTFNPGPRVWVPFAFRGHKVQPKMDLLGAEKRTTARSRGGELRGANGMVWLGTVWVLLSIWDQGCGS
jgi:hypothetical protein